VTPSGEVEVVGATQASAAPTSAPPRPAPTIEPSSALTSADGDRRAWLGAVVAAGIAASVVLVVVLGRRRSR
jgi:negative regulator of sigma E activity